LARALAAFRLLVRVMKRELRSTGSLALNNLLFATMFLLQGSNHKTVMFTALPFLILLGLPLLVVLSGDPVERIPPERLALWPLSAKDRFGLRGLGTLLSPTCWIATLMLLKGAGAASALFGFAVLVVLQFAVAGVMSATRRVPALRIERIVPPIPGRMGGILRLSLRQMLGVLDFYVALAVSVSGTAYRWFAVKPQEDAYPILAMAVALALSTYALRMFGMDGDGDARYRLLPVRGWEVLLAKDAAYLVVLSVLTLPLSLRAGLAFGLAALAIGRYPSLVSLRKQRRWRFVSGDLYGVLQIIGGLAAGFGSLQHPWISMGAAGMLYGISVFAGGRFWEKDLGRGFAAARRERRRKLAKGW
jgi:hypothetical protein